MQVAPDPMDSFSNDIYNCMFQYWIRFVGGNNFPVLQDKNSASCLGLGLCYGKPDPKVKKRVAQFAVCYNQVTLIPEFTGHIIQPNIPDGGGREAFRADTSVGNHLVAVDKTAFNTSYSNSVPLVII